MRVTRLSAAEAEKEEKVEEATEEKAEEVKEDKPKAKRGRPTKAAEDKKVRLFLTVSTDVHAMQKYLQAILSDGRKHMHAGRM